MTIVDELRARPGHYVGRGWFVPAEKPQRVARLVVTQLPGTSGVALDYEVISAEGKILHREHSMLVAPAMGSAVLLVAFEGESQASLFREVEPGLFAEEQDAPYSEGQMAVRIEARDAGVVFHAWCWADSDGRFAEVDAAELHPTS